MNVTGALFVTFGLITVTYGATGREENDTRQKQPTCKLSDYPDNQKPSKEKEFQQFARYEECQFHLFMDVVQEIDCYLIHKHGHVSDTEYKCDTDACLEAVFNMREEIYTHRFDNYPCKCNESRPSDSPGEDAANRYSFKSNLEYNYFIAKSDAKLAPNETISRLCEYTECWVDLWNKMHLYVQTKLDDHKENPENPMCTKIGMKNSVRCSSIDFTPEPCDPPTP